MEPSPPGCEHYFDGVAGRYAAGLLWQEGSSPSHSGVDSMPAATRSVSGQSVEKLRV